MKVFSIFLLALAPACFAQQWEFGAGAGGSFVKGQSVTSTAGSATAGFKPGAAFGAFLSQNLYPHVGGEIRYGFIMSDLRVKSGGQEAAFTGVSHVLHYDLLLTPSSRESRTQIFGAVGGGMKIFRGTGTETAYQPLSQFVFLTKTQEIKPMLSVGGGVKFSIAPRIFLRVEVRDYITPFPKDVIAPNPFTQAQIGGSMLHNIIPMASISFAL